MKYAAVVLAVAFAVGRFTLVGESHSLSVSRSYEAFAHLYVGALIGAAITARQWFWASVALGLTAVEVVAFVLGGGL